MVKQVLGNATKQLPVLSGSRETATDYKAWLSVQDPHGSRSSLVYIFSIEPWVTGILCFLLTLGWAHWLSALAKIRGLRLST